MFELLPSLTSTASSIGLSMNMLRGADRVNVKDGWLGFSSILAYDESAFTTLGFKLPILSGNSRDNESLDAFM